ncbi:MAG: protease modulator HflC [Spirochaetales bacterium]|nr:protease modulator HflC [Spirochaetales bacterium]MBO6048559.1 protease modulator HflC [Spirochaetales bacterium]MBP5756925.1 protease modulator HflC [Spirochaetales bacterium]
MKKAIITAIIVVALLVIVMILGPFYILQEGEQSVVTRFGAIVKVETEPGLKFKMPFVDTVVKYSSKILSWDGDAQRIPTKENQFIYVDPTSRWVISDPKRFYETVKTVENAQLRLDDILDSTVRTVISENYLNEAVRNSNRINQMTVVEEVSSIDDLEAAERLRSLTVSTTQQESIKIGRQGLSDRMLELASSYTTEYGIKLIDVIIRQIRYSDDLTESVYQRMIKERNQIAEAYRSYGRGQLAQWEGKTTSEQMSILSGAKARAEQIKGVADAEATRIYADAYKKDPKFFELWRSLESYKLTIPQMKKILSTDLAYFDNLYE